MLQQDQEHVLHLEMLHVQLLEAAINLPLVLDKKNLARFKNAVSLEPLICLVLMFASFSDPNVFNLAHLLEKNCSMLKDRTWINICRGFCRLLIRNRVFIVKI